MKIRLLLFLLISINNIFSTSFPPVPVHNQKYLIKQLLFLIKAVSVFKIKKQDVLDNKLMIYGTKIGDYFNYIQNRIKYSRKKKYNIIFYNRLVTKLDLKHLLYEDR